MSEAFITFIFLLICLALFVLSLLFRAVKFFINGYRQKKWLRRFAPENDNIDQCIVGFIPRDRISDVKTKIVLETTPGILQYGERRASYLMPYDRDSRVITLEFDRDSQLDLLIAKPWVARFIPPLIRFIKPEENKSYYFTGIDGFGFPNPRKTRKIFWQLAREFDGRTVAYNKPPSPVKLVLNVTLVAILFIVSGAILSGLKMGFARGPSSVGVALTGDVFTASHDYLYHLDSRGNLQNQYVLKALGIRGGIADLYAIDRDRVLIGDWETGTIQNCQLDRESCDPLPAFRDTQFQNFRFLRTFKFVVDRANNLIYATDTARHHLVILTADGKLIESTPGEDIKLCYPNGIAIANSETIAVADSNNFRILTWSTDLWGLDLTPERQVDFVRSPQPQTKCTLRESPGDRDSGIFAIREIAGRNEREEENIALPVADEGRIFPVFIDSDGRGFWWVLVGDSEFSRNNVLRFDRDWENPQKMPLPENLDISHLAVAEDRVLLTVPEAYEVWSISLDDLSVDFFGNERFQQAMYEARQSEINLRRFYYGSLGVAIAGVIILLGVAAWEQRQKAIDLLDLDPTLSDS